MFANLRDNGKSFSLAWHPQWIVFKVYLTQLQSSQDQKVIGERDLTAEWIDGCVTLVFSSIC